MGLSLEGGGDPGGGGGVGGTIEPGGGGGGVVTSGFVGARQRSREEAKVARLIRRKTSGMPFPLSGPTVQTVTAEKHILQKDVLNIVVSPTGGYSQVEFTRDSDGGMRAYSAAGGGGGGGDLLAANNLSDVASAATSRTNLGLAIGTNVQAYDADLTTWAGVTPAAGIATFLATPSSANLLAAVTDETGSGGSLVFATNPVLVGPTIGVATATSINKVVITTPASSATLTIASAAVLTVDGSTTLTSGTHSGTNTGDQTITLTGNVTGTGTGSFATTIAAAAVTSAMLRNSAAVSVIGRSANSSGVPADIAATPASGAVLRESGSTIGFGTIATAGIEDAAVTSAKLRDSTALTVIGRSANSSGVPADIAATAAAGGVLRESGSTVGFGYLQLGQAWLPSDESIFFDDWRTNATDWTNNNASGGGAYFIAATSTTHPGMWRVGAGGTAGGTINYYDGVASTPFAGSLTWETCIWIAGDTATIICRCGFSDTLTGFALPANGVFFEYIKATSANWRVHSIKASVATSTTSATAVSVGAWVKLKITFDGTTITYYVNGTSIGTCTTNLPTVYMSQWYMCYQNLISSWSSIDIDYTFLRQSALAR